jgi:hypothetical protein
MVVFMRISVMHPVWHLTNDMENRARKTNNRVALNVVLYAIPESGSRRRYMISNSGAKLSQLFLGVSGKISDGMGKETVVTFSLYCNQEYNLGSTGLEWADGLCRVSEESSILLELFDSGNAVRLSSDDLDATIFLTSADAFRVIGPIVKKSRTSSSNFLSSPLTIGDVHKSNQLKNDKSGLSPTPYLRKLVMDGAVYVWALAAEEKQSASRGA